MNGYLVGTSAHVRLGRDAAVAAAFDRHDPLRVRFRCSVIELEVMGSAPAKVFGEMRAAYRSADSELRMTPDVHDRAAEVQGLLADTSRHPGVGAADLLIAACAEINNVTVLHYDADFDTIADVTGQDVEWIVKRGSLS